MKHVVITVDTDNEYRVPAPDGREAGAYYTDDKDDALDTALLLWKGARAVIFKIKKVGVHPVNAL